MCGATHLCVWCYSFVGLTHFSAWYVCRQNMPGTRRVSGPSLSDASGHTSDARRRSCPSRRKDQCLVPASRQAFATLPKAFCKTRRRYPTAGARRRRRRRRRRPSVTLLILAVSVVLLIFEVSVVLLICVCVVLRICWTFSLDCPGGATHFWGVVLRICRTLLDLSVERKIELDRIEEANCGATHLLDLVGFERRTKNRT